MFCFSYLPGCIICFLSFLPVCSESQAEGENHCICPFHSHFPLLSCRDMPSVSTFSADVAPVTVSSRLLESQRLLDWKVPQWYPTRYWHGLVLLAHLVSAEHPHLISKYFISRGGCGEASPWHNVKTVNCLCDEATFPLKYSLQRSTEPLWYTVAWRDIGTTLLDCHAPVIS